MILWYYDIKICNFSTFQGYPSSPVLAEHPKQSTSETLLLLNFPHRKYQFLILILYLSCSLPFSGGCVLRQERLQTNCSRLWGSLKKYWPRPNIMKHLKRGKKYFHIWMRRVEDVLSWNKYSHNALKNAFFRLPFMKLNLDWYDSCGGKFQLLT